MSKSCIAFLFVLATMGRSQAVLHCFMGTSAGDNYAFPREAVARIGDIDGDGSPEIALGAEQASAGNSGPGYVEVRNASTGVVVLTIPAPAGSTNFGKSVASAGDYDADGRPDLVVGDPDAANGVGAAWVFSGATGRQIAALTGQAPGDQFGYCVDVLDDVDGIPGSEVAVGARGGDGYVRVFGISSSSCSVWSASGASGAQFGLNVAAIADLDGDGRRDLLVGAPKEMGGYGRVHVLSGASGNSLGAPIAGGDTSGNDGFGVDIAVIGDVDGDGADDFVVGAIYEDDVVNGILDAGAARVFSGASLTMIGAPLVGTGPSDGQGNIVGAVGDVDADGFADFLVAGDGDGGAGALQARIYSGATRTILFVIGGTRAGEAVLSCAPLGDLDGDGLGDFVLSGVISPAPRRGYARVWSGGHPFGGSREGLVMRSAVNGPPGLGYVHTAPNGSVMAARVDDPCGRFLGQPIVFLGSLFPTGSPPAPFAGYPSVRVGANAFRIPIPPPFPNTVVPSGNGVALVNPGVIGSGTSLIIQAIVLDPSSANSVFAASPACVFQ